MIGSLDGTAAAASKAFISGLTSPAVAGSYKSGNGASSYSGS